MTDCDVCVTSLVMKEACFKTFNFSEKTVHSIRLMGFQVDQVDPCFTLQSLITFYFSVDQYDLDFFFFFLDFLCTRSVALLTCVCLTAHADVSVARHLGCLVVGRLILLGNLCVLLGQKGHSLGHVAIAHLQRQCEAFF